jgi:hypothetical protein
MLKQSSYSLSWLGVDELVATPQAPGAAMWLSRQDHHGLVSR